MSINHTKKLEAERKLAKDKNHKVELLEGAETPPNRHADKIALQEEVKGWGR
jgi:hypothetical protein